MVLASLKGDRKHLGLNAVTMRIEAFTGKPNSRYGWIADIHAGVSRASPCLKAGGVAAVACMMAACTGTTSTSELSTSVVQGGDGLLTAEERALGCKKITGRMQVRILQIRDHSTRSKSSSISRGLQSAVEPIFGGNGQGKDPDGKFAADRAKLEAMNGLLREKNCASFDLKAELQPKDVTATPTPTIPPKGKKKK